MGGNDTRSELIVIDLANSSGREYGNKCELLEQDIIYLKTDSPMLEQKMISANSNDLKKNLYDGIPDIL